MKTSIRDYSSVAVKRYTRASYINEFNILVKYVSVEIFFMSGFPVQGFLCKKFFRTALLTYFACTFFCTQCL